MKLQVVVGGQFGSEGKGHVCAQLAAKQDGLLAVRIAGPNAGHTVIDPLTGQPIALRHVPVAAVVNPTARLALGAGSEIDPNVLEYEINMLADRGIEVENRLMIDPQATWLEPIHIEQEAAANIQKRIGSTAKGIGAARVARTWRHARLIGEDTIWSRNLGNVANYYGDFGVVQIEGTQGYGLGLHAGWYPKCTSSDCRAIDFMAMAGISPWDPDITTLEVWVTLRTYPIRVAGDSGELKEEMTWDEVSLEAGRPVSEKTTVTQKVRRVGKWDPELARRAIWENGGPSEPVKVALTFLDYWLPELKDKPVPTGYRKAQELLDLVEDQVGVRPSMVTTGPNSATFL